MVPTLKFLTLAAALQLIEVARTKSTGKRVPSSPHSVVATVYYSVLYLFRDGLENVICTNLKIFCTDKVLKISEDGSNLATFNFNFGDIEIVYHQSDNEKYPFTVLKIILKTGLSYIVCAEGSMIPFLGELVKVKIVSLEFDTRLI
jgi:hypothetical protein